MCHSTAGQDLATTGVVLTVSKAIQREILRRLSVVWAKGEGRARDPTVEYCSHIELIEFDNDEELATVNNGLTTTPISNLSVMKIAHAGQMCPSQSGQRLATRKFVTTYQKGLSVLIVIRVANAGQCSLWRKMCHSTVG